MRLRSHEKTFLVSCDWNLVQQKQINEVINNEQAPITLTPVQLSSNHRAYYSLEQIQNSNSGCNL